MPMPGSAPTDQSPTWSDPPKPRQQPVSRAKSSAIMLARGDALGQRLAVTAMRDGDPIGRAQRCRAADRAGLLAHREVDRPGDLALEEQAVDPLLELADEPHAGGTARPRARARAGATSIGASRSIGRLDAAVIATRCPPACRAIPTRCCRPSSHRRHGCAEAPIYLSSPRIIPAVPAPGTTSAARFVVRANPRHGGSARPGAQASRQVSANATGMSRAAWTANGEE